MHPITQAPQTPSKQSLTESNYNATIVAASANPSAQLNQKRKRIIHKQGSRSIGARFATVDYVDTKALSIHNLSPNAGDNMLAHIQGDSAVSLTSSNDSVNLALSPEMTHTATDRQQVVPSVCDNQSNGTSQTKGKASNASPCHSSSSSGDDSYYEKTVETYLENDGIFRDSAFYSDDNIEKAYIRTEHIYSTIDEVHHEVRMKPALPPKLSLQKIQSIVARTAPPIPRMAKPGVSRASQQGDTVDDRGPPKTAPPRIPDIEPVWSTGDRRASEKYHNTSDFSIGNASFDDDMSNEQQSQSFSSSEFSLPPPTAPPPPPPIPPRLNKKSQWIQMKCELFEK